MLDTKKLLMLMETNGKITCAQLASMLGCDEREVTETVGTLEKNKTILGYTAIVDWEKTDRELVTALIEVKVSGSIVTVSGNSAMVRVPLTKV